MRKFWRQISNSYLFLDYLNVFFQKEILVIFRCMFICKILFLFEKFFQYKNISSLWKVQKQEKKDKEKLLEFFRNRKLMKTNFFCFLLSLITMETFNQISSWKLRFSQCYYRLCRICRQYSLIQCIHQLLLYLLNNIIISFSKSLLLLLGWCSWHIPSSNDKTFASFLCKTISSTK